VKAVGRTAYGLTVVLASALGLSMLAEHRTEQDVRRTTDGWWQIQQRAEARATAAGFTRNPCLPPSPPLTRHADGSMSFSLVAIDDEEFVRCSVSHDYLTEREAREWQRSRQLNRSRLFPADWQIIPTPLAVAVWTLLALVVIAVPLRRVRTSRTRPGRHSFRR
jgi:hypothetical protein